MRNGKCLKLRDQRGVIVVQVQPGSAADRARVLEMRGKVEQVRGAAAEQLQTVGNIGALLRF